MAKINVRSPYYIYKTQTNLESVILNVWIYSGTQGVRPAAATYSLSSVAVNEAVNYDIAELVRDYMTYNSEDYETPIVWVDYQINKTVGGEWISKTEWINKTVAKGIIDRHPGLRAWRMQGFLAKCALPHLQNYVST